MKILTLSIICLISISARAEFPEIRPMVINCDGMKMTITNIRTVKSLYGNKPPLIVASTTGPFKQKVDLMRLFSQSKYCSIHPEKD